MSNRRRFLHVIGASFVSAGASAAGLGCSDGGSGGAGDGGEGGSAAQGGSAGNQGGSGQGGSSGNQGGSAGASGEGGSGGASGEGGSAGASGEGGSGGAGGQGGSGTTPPGFPVGAPADFTAAKGLHKVSGKKVLIGYDAGGLYALTAICTHQSCDMSGKDGKIMGSGAVQCTCHGSVFTPDGAAVVGPASGTLKAYALALGDDGLLYVDTSTKVANTVRLSV